MPLPYLVRAMCLALCGAGVLQAALELAGWAVCPALLRAHARSSARRTERLLFALALVARLTPWLLALLLLLPAYLRTEDNHAAERVSLVSLGFAAFVLLWSFAGLLRVAQAVDAGRRCVRRSYPEASHRHGSSVRLYPDHPSLIAVAGVVRTTILVSTRLLEEGRFPPATLDIALAHEWAHVRQRDNLKGLLLALLPHAAFATAAWPSLEAQWRLAAEMAADEDGTGGRPERSVLLAGMLVALARDTMQPLPRGITALHADSEHLRRRVERLLERLPSSAVGASTSWYAGLRAPDRFATVLVVAASALLLTTLCALCLLQGHHAAEFLFHGA